MAAGQGANPKKSNHVRKILLRLAGKTRPLSCWNAALLDDETIIERFTHSGYDFECGITANAGTFLPPSPPIPRRA